MLNTDVPLQNDLGSLDIQATKTGRYVGLPVSLTLDAARFSRSQRASTLKGVQKGIHFLVALLFWTKGR
jgi:hypothetical protein